MVFLFVQGKTFLKSEGGGGYYISVFLMTCKVKECKRHVAVFICIFFCSEKTFMETKGGGYYISVFFITGKVKECKRDVEVFIYML